MAYPPLQTSEGRVLGTLALYWREPHVAAPRAPTSRSPTRSRTRLPSSPHVTSKPKNASGRSGSCDRGKAGPRKMNTKSENVQRAFSAVVKKWGAEKLSAAPRIACRDALLLAGNCFIVHHFPPW
jgi:hypothetical protein